MHIIQSNYLSMENPIKMKLNHSCLSSLSILLLIVFLFRNLPCLEGNVSANETDLLALLKFKDSITRDPNRIFKSWNSSLHFCNWFGITCNQKHQRVTSMVLRGQNLNGFISPYLGNLSFLRFIDFQNNNLHGQIPQEIGRLFRLQYLVLANNTFGGEIPVNLTHCLQLKMIDLTKNNIVKKIPFELGSLSELEVLHLGKNHLLGAIPASIGNLSLLRSFVVEQNNLVGNIPGELGKLTSLEDFSAGMNKFSGEIPPSIFNTSSMKSFNTPANQLSGIIPDNIGFTLQSLTKFQIGENRFSGSIPSSLSNASHLQYFDINSNYFVGHVPSNLGNLKGLIWFNLGFNKLGNNSETDMEFLVSLRNCSNLENLNFAANNLGGVLSNFLGNLSTSLSALYFGGNHFSGTIPEALGDLFNLIVLGAESNRFTGGIPSSFGKLQKLQGLNLEGNRLSGQIPSFIGNLSHLSMLLFSLNQFEGNFPESIKNCQNLILLDVSHNTLKGSLPLEVLGLSSLSIYLNLSWNSFTGKLPEVVGKLKNVNSLDISENRLSGEIPSTIGECSSLEYLYLQGNFFQGTIPSSLSFLKGLRHLDLSRNNLTGEIPKNLQNLTFLQYLNLSFNHLGGEVPTGGVLRNASFVSLTGNGRLCGGIQELHLPRCPDAATKKSSRSRQFKLKIIIICVVLPLLSLSGFAIYFLTRKPKKKPSSTTPDMNHFEKISYTELYQATNGFSSSNLIGSGSFSTVYKGVLNQQERPIAVKVLDLQQKGASKSIMAECNVLRNIRHRNLVKIITFCSSLDYKGNEFKALVLEFMANGSLDDWLHQKINSESQELRRLDLLKRLDIAIDVASALHYLHDLCENTVLHYDLKPSNVLLDNDIVAHVSDFGLAKLLSNANDSSQSNTSTVGIKGTIGYAPPKYGMGCEATREGDIYSYGILILEMFSGRRPTDEIFKDGLNLHDFMKAAFRRKTHMEVLDPTLLSRYQSGEDNQNGIEERHEKPNPLQENVEKCLFSVLEIGISCSAESPRDRMNMEDVTRRLHSIKNALVQAEKHRGKRARGRH